MEYRAHRRVAPAVIAALRRAAVRTGLPGAIIIRTGRHPRPRVDAALIERFSPSGTLPAMHTDTFPMPDLAWQEEALCAQTGGDFFFPEPGSSVREAKRICGLCPIRATCLEYALSHDMRFGVWGGMSEKERLALRRAGR